MTPNDRSGSVALVTGGTGGIGKETARALAERGASVVVVGIDRERGLRAVQDIRDSAGHDRVHAVSADVTTLDGLRRLAEAVGERHDRLDVLVNNVGVNLPARTLTADGVERMFAAHVLAPFTLTHLLLPLLERAPAARVVNLTGGIPGGPIDPGNLLGERRYLGWTFSHYNHTKTMTMAMTHRLAARLRGSGVTANVVYPGHGHTPMNRATPLRAFPIAYRPIAPLVLKVIAPLFLSDLTRSARSSVYAATSPDLDGVSGAYVDGRCRRRPLPAPALDPAAQEAVWELCVRLSAPVLGGVSPA
ncbi:short-chain dehydrogenase [[Actinomadura] parvosata subsp. kistnae]|uniref:Short-chain dehydrogenase n=1 Tax=[Actinomadura] parvosata subsp. kistnae TaxID=1909395 RepID=A0A1V0A4U4_9ACTN|nr:SDR family NAD(P)-dependent oxidoreductase [Nonomuraea sp. ATCC 55076]AQZ65223.1 short-chain dehydrogenase [Nonomuraea sp. ATCC 55076]